MTTTNDLLDRVAKFISECAEDAMLPSRAIRVATGLRDELDHIRASPSQEKAGDYVLVPREPTQSMLKAGVMATYAGSGPMDADNLVAMERRWNGMLDAAPTHPTPDADAVITHMGSDKAALTAALIATHPTPEAGADLLDRMAEALRAVRVDGGDVTAIDSVLAEHDRLRASQAQQVAGVVKSSVIPEGADAYTILDLVKRAAFFGWQHASWTWDCVEGACDEAFPEFPFVATPITHPTPEADAVAPVATPESVVSAVYGAVFAAMIDAGSTASRARQSAEKFSERARPAATEAKAGAVTDAAGLAIALRKIIEVYGITLANIRVGVPDPKEYAARALKQASEIKKAALAPSSPTGE